MAKKLNYDILIRPSITEKSLKLVDELNQYSFEVARHAKKMEIKKAVEDKFDVTVLKVRVIRKRGKRVEWGSKRIRGSKKNKKVAIVTLKGSDSIDIFKVT